MENLSKAFAGRPVLTRFCAVFPQGACTALMGESGRGKTTLLRILMGLEFSDAGTVEGVAGRRLAAVFQEDRLLPRLSARRNLQVACPEATDAQIDGHLAAVGLEESANQRACALSGGMRRRVAVARAVLYKPEIMLLDEPFRGIDPENRARTASYILSCCAGATIVLVTHDPEEARLLGASSVLRLD